MLFKTIDEFSAVFPLSKSLDLDMLKPMIRVAEEDFIIPFLSQDQYDDLNTAYDVVSPSLTTAQTNLLAKVRRPIAGKAMLDSVPSLNVNVGKNGIGVNKPAGAEIASQYRIEDLKRFARTEFFQGIEAMLRFLEANSGVYTLWAASSAFTEYTSSFVRNSEEFSKHYFIDDSRYIFTRVRPTLLDLHEIVKGITGVALYDEIITQLRTDSVSAANAVLLTFIRPGLVNLTIGQSLSQLVPMFNDLGIRVVEVSMSLNLTSERAPDPKLIFSLEQKALDKGKEKLKDLQDYLYKHVDDYPLFEADPNAYRPDSSQEYNDLDNTTFGFGI